MAKKNDTNADRGETTPTPRAPVSGEVAAAVTTGVTTAASGAPSRPLRTFRLKGVKASVFENRTEQGAFYKTSLQKVYRDGDEWKTTASLGRDDLPVARLLLGRAWEFILETEASARAAEPGE